jgi:hypothetical protein
MRSRAIIIVAATYKRHQSAIRSTADFYFVVSPIVEMGCLKSKMIRGELASGHENRATTLYSVDP